MENRSREAPLQDMGDQLRVLDELGDIVMRSIRDASISHWDQVLAGTMKGSWAERDRAVIADEALTKQQLVQCLAPRIVDTVLHYMLAMLDERSELRLSVQTDSGILANAAHASDGLAGELYGADGWIARFSSCRHDEA